MRTKCKTCGQDVMDIAPPDTLTWHHPATDKSVPPTDDKLLIIHRYYGLTTGHYSGGWSVLLDNGWVEIGIEDVQWWAYAPKASWEAFT